MRAMPDSRIKSEATPKKIFSVASFSVIKIG